MKSAKMMYLVILIVAPLLNGVSSAHSEELSIERFECKLNGKTFEFTAPMPKTWTKEQKELASKNLCNTWGEVIENDGKVVPTEKNEDDEQFNKPNASTGPDHQAFSALADGSKENTSVISGNVKHEIDEVLEVTINHTPTIKLAKGKSNIDKAVCDTDYNCEVLWEKYHKFGIAKIMMAPEERQRKGVDVLEVTCKNDNILRYTSVEKELPTICASPYNIVQRLEAQAKATGGSTTDFQLNWRELDTLIAKGFAQEKKSVGHSPAASRFRDLGKSHPEVLVGGIFRNKEGTERLSKVLEYSCAEGTPCYELNYGLTITELTVRFGNEKDIPQWFLNFCSTSRGVENLTSGFWYCRW
jgi:hypothetical protein